MARALYKGTVLAESNNIQRVEGNIYFPPDAIDRSHFQASDLHTTCPWKGVASYYDIVVDGEVVKNAAWTYPEPKYAAKNITDHVAFYGMVTVEP